MALPARRALETWRIDPQLVETIVGRAGAGRHKRFRAGDAVYLQGSTTSKFYFVLSGLLQVSIISADGSEIILEFMGPNTICGEGSAFDRLPRFSSAYAVDASEVIEFDASEMGAIFREHPEFASVLLSIISLKQRILAVRLEHLASREPEGRIMELFRRLGEMFATDHPGGRLLATQLTHEHIAAMTGTSRVTVTRALQRLRDQGFIEVIDGHILVRPDHQETNA